MSLPVDRSRRYFLRAAAGSVPVIVLAGAASACTKAPTNDRQLRFVSLEQALTELKALTQAEALPPATAWNWAQTLTHCAQSIEYSMSGFPQAKSPVFQRTVGATAFKLFSWNGRMTHDLGEPIPGAPALDAGEQVEVALNRLQQAVANFQQWDQPLQPHFAYGELSKAEYEQAHAMHLANHFSAFHQKA